MKSVVTQTGRPSSSAQRASLIEHDRASRTADSGQRVHKQQIRLLVDGDDRRGLVGFGLIHALDAHQIIEDCVDVLGVDRSLVGCAHFVDFRLPLCPARCFDRDYTVTRSRLG